MPDAAAAPSIAPALVRNLQRGITVFTSPKTGDEVRWEGMNNVDGEDFQYVPVDVLQTPPFLQAITKGIFEIVEADDQTKAALEQQAESWKRRQDIIDRQTRDTIDHTTDRTIDHVAIDEKGTITGVPTEVETKNRDQGKTVSHGDTVTDRVVIDQRQPSPITQ